MSSPSALLLIVREPVTLNLIAGLNRKSIQLKIKQANDNNNLVKGLSRAIINIAVFHAAEKLTDVSVVRAEESIGKDQLPAER